MSNQNSKTFDIATARQKAALLDAKLKPIAKRSVDVNDPAWIEKMRSSRPLDEAGVRQEAETLLDNLLKAYRTGDSQLRAAIRALFALNPSFAWAAAPAQPANTPEGFRARLLRISARDRTQDLRDAILSINQLCVDARAAGIDPTPILTEIASMSSAESEDSNPSMADLLKRAR
jgi:hypothetical protein